MSRLAFALIGAVALGGCHLQREVVVRDATIAANGTIVALDNVQATALVVYREQQVIAVQAVKATCDDEPAVCADMAREKVEAIRAEWQPVWMGIDSAVEAHDALAVGIEAVADGELRWTELLPLIVEGQEAAREAAQVVRALAGDR